NDDIDEGWICDRGRFDYTDVNDPARLRTPSINGARAAWADAISAVAAGITGRGARLGVSLPQDITNEEAFLFRRLLDGPLKGARVKMHGRTAIPAPAGDLMRIKEIDDARVIVVVASDLEDDVPIVDLRVKKAVTKRGAKLIVVHPEGVDLDRHPGTVHIRNAKGSAAAEVRKLASHEWLKSPGGPVAILFGVGRDRAGVLPAPTFAERQGSSTNLEGTVQFLRPPIPVLPPLKEGWEVLCELGAALGVALDFDGVLAIQRAISLPSPDLEPSPTPVLVGPAHP